MPAGLAAILIIVGVPLAALAGLATSIFGLQARRTATEVATYLRDCVEGRGGERDWDDFTSVQIRDPYLERIRQKAAAIDLPVNDEGFAVLRELLIEAENLANLGRQADAG